jgi:hypothetical protein
MCTIDHIYSVSMGGRAAWNIKPSDVIKVGDDDFVKLKAYDYSLVKLVCEGVMEHVPKNATLSNCPGFVELIKLRNDVQAKSFQPAAAAAAALFEAPQVQQTKRKKQSAAEVRRMRDSPTAFTVSLQLKDSVRYIPVIRPAHPCDEVCVKMEPEVLEAVICFVREAGMSEDDLVNKRSYRTEDLPKGVWSTKGGQYVVKLGAGSDGKYKRAKTAQQAMRLAGHTPNEPNDVGEIAKQSDIVQGCPSEGASL